MNEDKSIIIDKSCSIEDMRTNCSSLNVVSSVNYNASDQSSLKRHSQSENVHSSISSNEQNSLDSKRLHLDKSIPPNQSLKDILDNVNEENKVIATEGDVNTPQLIPRPLTPECKLGTLVTYVMLTIQTGNNETFISDTRSRMQGVSYTHNTPGGPRHA